MKDAREGGKGCFVSSPLPLGGFTSPRTRIAIMRHPNKLCPYGERREGERRVTWRLTPAWKGEPTVWKFPQCCQLFKNGDKTVCFNRDPPKEKHCSQFTLIFVTKSNQLYLSAQSSSHFTFWGPLFVSEPGVISPPPPRVQLWDWSAELAWRLV